MVYRWSLQSRSGFANTAGDYTMSRLQGLNAQASGACQESNCGERKGENYRHYRRSEIIGHQDASARLKCAALLSQVIQTMWEARQRARPRLFGDNFLTG